MTLAACATDGELRSRSPTPAPAFQLKPSQGIRPLLSRGSLALQDFGRDGTGAGNRAEHHDSSRR